MEFNQATARRFRNYLEAKYKDDRLAPEINTHIDPDGQIQWINDWIQLQDEGKTPLAAAREVNNRINVYPGGTNEVFPDPFFDVELPIPIPLPPSEPGTWPTENKADVFNMQIDGEIWWDWVGMDLYKPTVDTRLQYLSSARLTRLYQEILSRGHTRLHYTISDIADAFENPSLLIPALNDCIAHGIGPVIEMLPPGSENAWRDRWTKNPRNYLNQVPKFLRGIEGLYAYLLFGVEMDAIFPATSADETDPICIEIAKAMRSATDKPIWAHFSSGWHGEWGNSWWGSVKNELNGLAFQYKKSEKGNGFDTDNSEVVEAVTVYKQRLKSVSSNLEFVHSEAVHKRSESRSIELANLALSKGALFSMNG